ncbi:MAG TPA: hypothetical protein VGE52_10850 [Pirellulales bacterium]
MTRRLFGAVSSLAASSLALTCAFVSPVAISAQEPTPAGPRPTPSVVEAAPRAAIALQYKFTKGETIRWSVVHHVKVDTTVQGHTQVAETHSESIKRWDVTDVLPNGDALVTHSVEKVNMWQELQGRARVTYNSDTDQEAPEGFTDVKKSVGVPLSILQLSPTGKLVSREVKHKGPGLGSGDADQQVTPPLPAKAAPLGAVWNLDVPLVVDNGQGQQRGFQARDRFEFVKLSGNQAIIQFETVLPPVNEPAVEAMLIQHTGAGEIHFDVKSGRIVKTERKVDKAVVGFRGAASRIHFISRFTETLAPTTVAQKPTPAR